MGRAYTALPCAWYTMTKDAEDLVQETFLQAFQAIRHFEGRSELRTWLYRITYNGAMMRFRWQHATVSVDDVLEESGAVIPEQLTDWCCLPEPDFQTDEVRAQLEQAIRELPETLRAVFVLRQLEDISTQDAADMLNVSAEVVK